ncbi:MAG: reverse transcriptase/maturase family protein, partial [Bacteroidales bacterium]
MEYSDENMNVNLLEDLFTAYYCARKNKRNTNEQIRFELNLEDNLVRLYHELINKTYQVGPCNVFMINDPVKREIFAAGFADRVIHHLYFNYVNPIFEPTFIDDSYSCRKGKGTMYGIKRLDHHIRSCSENFTKECYVLKLDISGYFMAVDRNRLLKMVLDTLSKRFEGARKKIEDAGFSPDYELIVYLSKVLILHNPVDNCVINCADWNSERKGLPPDKSLFLSSPNCGLPIGNLTSQLFSNIYLNEFDHFVKRSLKIKHYGRYVDDFFLVHSSKEVLKDLIPRINEYLKCNLKLTLHPKKIYLQRAEHGIPYLGAVIKP